MLFLELFTPPEEWQNVNKHVDAQRVHEHPGEFVTEPLVAGIPRMLETALHSP